jgi:hypothetical protein
VIEADALAAKQGRAEDVTAAIYYQINPNARARIGYRLLEGGADVESTYNFALFHYILVGLQFGL